MKKRSNTRAGDVLTHLAMVVLSALSLLPTAVAQVSDNASGQLTMPFRKTALAALAGVHRWREKAMVEAQSGMRNSTYGEDLRGAAYEDLGQAQFTTKSVGDKQTGDLLRQHFANVKSWVDGLVQARQDMGMDPAGLGQNPELLRLDECEKAFNTMLGNGTYTGIDAC